MFTGFVTLLPVKGRSFPRFTRLPWPWQPAGKTCGSRASQVCVSYTAGTACPRPMVLKKDEKEEEEERTKRISTTDFGWLLEPPELHGAGKCLLRLLAQDSSRTSLPKNGPKPGTQASLASEAWTHRPIEPGGPSRTNATRRTQRMRWKHTERSRGRCFPVGGFRGFSKRLQNGWGKSQKVPHTSRFR